MKYMLIARLRSYTSLPPDEFVWDFGDDEDLARITHRIWSKWMGEGLWEFHNWGWPGKTHLIKPGGISELDFRIAVDRL